MKKITFFFKNKSTNLDFNFKSLNKNLYNKSLFRDKLYKSKKSFLIDNNTRFDLVSLKKDLLVSASFNSKLYSFKSCGSNLFFFNLNKFSFSNLYEYFILKLNKLLYCLNFFSLLQFKNNKINSLYVYIIKPLKGGFLSYFNGVIGYFSMLSFFSYFRVYFSKIFLLSLNKKIKTFFYFNYLPKRFPILNLYLRIYPDYLKKTDKNIWSLNKKLLKLSNKLHISFTF
jgi:hypothetical protein